MAVKQVGNVVEYLCQECGSQGMVWADPWTTHRQGGSESATSFVQCPVCGRTARALFKPRAHIFRPKVIT